MREFWRLIFKSWNMSELMEMYSKTRRKVIELTLGGCIVLYRWGGHCCPIYCNHFKINFALPNLGITRTWICQLNFAQRPIFLGLRFFNKPEISDSGPQLIVPPGGLVLRIFTSWKNPSTSAGFERANLGSRGKHVTLKPPRQTSGGQEWIRSHHEI